MQLSLSFDDVLLIPSESHVTPSQVDISGPLGPLDLSIPILSAAMDTVTESKMAISMALLGGMGVLHKNCTIEFQSDEVRRVKKFQHAMIAQPLTVHAEMALEEVRKLIDESGVSGFPVIDSKGKLVGICTGRDLRYATEKNLRVKDVMSAPVITLPEGSSREDAIKFFRKHKVEKLPLVNKKGELKGLITSKDLRQAVDYPKALRDKDGGLKVAGAVGVGEKEMERAEALVSSGVDCLVVDSAHGHSGGVIDAVKQIRKKFKDVVIIAGNVGTDEGALALAKAGAQIVKVGMGPGSICTTRIVSGAGMPQLSAVMSVSTALKKSFPNIGIIADGGIRYSGDIAKALAAGAHSVMLGGLLAGTDESPGELVLLGGRSYKLYRGMGSLGAMRKGRGDRYGQGGITEAAKLVPEGVEARVPHRGPLSQVIFQLTGGLKSGMGYVGAATLKEFQKKARFTQISNVALRESHVHDVAITAEAPNYSMGGGAKSE